MHVPEAAETSGFKTIEGEFYTEHLVVLGRLACPESRLSDHLNSATTTFDLSPARVQRSLTGLRVNVTGNRAYITKSHLLFVLPVLEPTDIRSGANPRWTPTLTQTCWAGVGRYSLVGSAHMAAEQNPRLFMRSLEQRRFLPLTDVKLTFPDGAVKEYATVIVNRHHVELLALQSDVMQVVQTASDPTPTPGLEQAAQ